MKKYDFEIIVKTYANGTKKYIPGYNLTTLFYVIKPNLSVRSIVDFETDIISDAELDSFESAKDVIDRFYKIHYTNHVASIESIPYDPAIKESPKTESKDNNDDINIHIITIEILNDDDVDDTSKLPKQWGLMPGKEYYIIGSCSRITRYTPTRYNDDRDRNSLPTEQIAEQVLAIEQLLTMREVYRNGWKPKKYDKVYNINRFNSGELYIVSHYHPDVLSFQSHNIAQEFLNNFKDLIVQAGDLIP